ncbi:MAG: FAD:protein FMN transferase [Clostridium sp.]|nr:FAD:protein FMN transferase [Clostridium sp.]
MDKKLSAALKMLALSMALVFLYQLGVEHKNDIARSGSQTEFAYVNTSADGRESRIEDYRMGTSVSVTVYGAGAKETAALTFACIDRLDGQVLTLEIDRLVADYKVGEPYRVSDELYHALSGALSVCADSNGALDITIEPLNRLWGIEGKYDGFQVPGDDEIGAALDLVGYENISAYKDSNNEAGYILINKENIDFAIGAIGKGYALDVIREELEKSEAQGACVIIGGSILVYGSKINGEGFTVGIRNPRGNETELIGCLTFEANETACISTSGDYEKYVMADGVRYHHIFDRSTGYPSRSGLISVTVVCESGLYSDGLSTACFVLGYDKSLGLLEKYNAEAVFVEEDGTIIVTDGLKGKFMPINE